MKEEEIEEEEKIDIEDNFLPFASGGKEETLAR